MDAAVVQVFPAATNDLLFLNHLPLELITKKSSGCLVPTRSRPESWNLWTSSCFWIMDLWVFGDVTGAHANTLLFSLMNAAVEIQKLPEQHSLSGYKLHYY
jgi:hypothetical protein